MYTYGQECVKERYIYIYDNNIQKREINEIKRECKEGNSIYRIIYWKL